MPCTVKERKLLEQTRRDPGAALCHNSACIWEDTLTCCVRQIPWKNNFQMHGNCIQQPHTTLSLLGSLWLIDLTLACLRLPAASASKLALAVGQHSAGIKQIPWKNNFQIHGNYTQQPHTTSSLLGSLWLIDLPFACLRLPGGFG